MGIPYIRFYRKIPGGKSRIWLLAGLRQSLLPVLILVVLASAGYATPPGYITFGRPQKAEYSPKSDELLRIWMVFVDQGDGIIIQLPTRYDYNPGVGDNSAGNAERIDILIDGGSAPRKEDWRIGEFFTQLYDGDRAILEYGVLSHHDDDHVAGMIRLLANDHVTFGTIYHNGLASYRPGNRNFAQGGMKPERAICVFSNHKLLRGMAFWDSYNRIEGQYLIDNLGQLRLAFDGGEFYGIYDNLADAVLHRADSRELSNFDRAYVGAPFISERERGLGRDLPGLAFDILWPPDTLRAYGGGDWGKTINGNSLVFRLKYGDFEMLFPGDLNKESEIALLSYWRDRGMLDLLACDVLKVPHHGSADGCEEFFHGAAINPVVSVASMGDKGFRSKAVCRNNWQHPSTEVIRWLGGVHRFYSTFSHERRFGWPEIDNGSKRENLIERTHILIETDGKWFRVVELPEEGSDIRNPPSVEDTRRGNGTRWIRAEEGE